MREKLNDLLRYVNGDVLVRYKTRMILLACGFDDSAGGIYSRYHLPSLCNALCL